MIQQINWSSLKHIARPTMRAPCRAVAVSGCSVSTNDLYLSCSCAHELEHEL